MSLTRSQREKVIRYHSYGYSDMELARLTQLPVQLIRQIITDAHTPDTTGKPEFIEPPLF